MTSDRQRASNRANSQHSTGPRSAEGKARSARNRASHCLTGAHAILPGEDAAAFDCLKAALIEEHQPAGETEAHLVDELAHNQWKLLRAERMEIAALTRSLEAPGEPRLTDDVLRVARYQASIRRAWNNAFTRLRQAQSDRRQREAASLGDALTSCLNESKPDSPNTLYAQPDSADPSVAPAPPPCPHGESPHGPAPQ